MKDKKNIKSSSNNLTNSENSSNNNKNNLSELKKDKIEKKNKKIKKIKNKLKNMNELNKKLDKNLNNKNESVNLKSKDPKNIIIRPFNKNLMDKFNTNSNINNNKEFKKEIKAYQDSFDDIIAFSKKFTALKKKAINCIIFHTENSDGVMSANIAIKYLLENKKTDINLVPAKPFSGHGKVDPRLTQYEDKIKDRNVLIIDLQYNDDNIKYIKDLSKNIYIIDDHSINNKKNNGHFVGDSNHASIAYTWKFFYPKVDVPKYVQIIDNDDRKLHERLPHLSKYRNMSSFFNYRIFHNPYLKIKFDSISDFENLDSVVNDEYKMISNLIGHYYDELANNIKEQVARNARPANFQGHPVHVLNYNDPVLSRMVARQILTNAKMRGDNIHFAVLWGYEYTSQAYRVQLCEFHGGKPKYNLALMAKTLGNIGGSSRGGGGDKYVGNFYWPKSKDKDIWDLFSKNYIKNKMN